MDELVRSIFDMAILREQLAAKKYIKMANSAIFDQSRDILIKMAEEEKRHERILSNLDISVINVVNSQEIENISLLKDVEVDDVNEYQLEEINKALDIAISEEQSAFDDYNMVAKHLDFGPAKEVLKELATQEAQHKRLLQEIKEVFNEK